MASKEEGDVELGRVEKGLKITLGSKAQTCIGVYKLGIFIWNVVSLVWRFLLSPFIPVLDIGSDILTLVTYDRLSHSQLSRDGLLPRWIYKLALASIVVPNCIPPLQVFLTKAFKLCGTKCPAVTACAKHYERNVIPNTSDTLLLFFWPLCGPFYFIYAKIINDQDKLNKFYGFNIYEILLESGPQMITQWYVIFNYMEIFEGKSNIPWTRIEYNKLPWAITSATLSTVSVVNGLRLAINVGRNSFFRCARSSQEAESGAENDQ